MSQQLREIRHNPCLMKPVSTLVLFVFCLVSLLTLLLHIPEFIVGLLLAPILQRSFWFVEFLYPSGVARWAHFFLLKLTAKKKRWGKTLGNLKTHSRTIEQRVEVIKGRVYIHPIPQLLDNVGYLIVCCPRSPPQENGGIETPAVALLVDCGDAYEVTSHIKAIGDVHYPHSKIELHYVLCTHKHHDHTAGNADLVVDPKVSQTLVHIYGGAVEKVPHCTKEVSNGDMIELPSVTGNDMNELVELEVIAVPCHTRGSVVYSLRTKQGEHKSAFVFTGDTMFSGGSGMPFEADTLSPRDSNPSRKHGNSPIRASAGSNAVERCFAEVLVRSLPCDTVVTGQDYIERILVFPGHEYTSELMTRQFSPSPLDDSSQWCKLSPFEYFEVASHLFVSNHRRALPKNGKLLTVPSPLSRELVINPHFRTMKKRGQQVVNAIRIWYNYFANEPIVLDNGDDSDTIGLSDIRIRRTFSGQASPASSADPPSPSAVEKTPSSSRCWNLTTEECRRPVFTTLYTSDLESIIEDLQSQKISPQKAANRLAKMKTNMETPAIGRRPIPGTLPSDKNIYMGVLGLALLGSPPNALTVSDSRMMKMPAPVECSDYLLISKKRLVAVLSALGLIADAAKGRDLVSMIDLLWREAQSYNEANETEMLNSNHKASYDATPADLEATPDGIGDSDEIELAVLRWTLYGVQMKQPSWFSKFCMPCGGSPTELRKFPVHPAHEAGMRRTNGELVRHDVATCPVCRDSVGCPAAEEPKQNGHSSQGAVEASRYSAKLDDSEDVMPSDEESEDDIGDDGVEMEVLELLQHRGSEAFQ